MRMNNNTMRILIFLFVLASANMCGQSKKIINTPPPTVEAEEAKTEMSFDFDHVDFGMVKKGEKRETSYSFTNTGTEDIIIDLVTACECTELTYLAGEAIIPGEKGTIDVVFDSGEKDAAETITIDIILRNTNPKNGYPIVYQLTYDFDIEKP